MLVCRTYLLELVHSSLQHMTTADESNGRLPVSVTNISYIADEFVAAADMLPTLLVHSDSDDSEKQVRCWRSVVSLPFAKDVMLWDTIMCEQNTLKVFIDEYW